MFGIFFLSSSVYREEMNSFPAKKLSLEFSFGPAFLFLSLFCHHISQFSLKTIELDDNEKEGTQKNRKKKHCNDIHHTFAHKYIKLYRECFCCCCCCFEDIFLVVLSFMYIFFIVVVWWTFVR